MRQPFQRPRGVPWGLPATIVSKMIAYVQSHPWALTAEIARECKVNPSTAYIILKTLKMEGKMTTKPMPTYKKGKKPIGWNWNGSHDYRSDSATLAYMKQYDDAKAMMEGQGKLAAELKAKLAVKKEEVAGLVKERKAAIAQREKYKKDMKKLQGEPLYAPST